MRTEPVDRLARSPLAHVLAQVRFSPILKMRDYLPEVQEALRKAGFARFQEQASQTVTFGPELKAETGHRWVFSTVDRVQSAVLTNDFVVYETSSYDTFERFLARTTGVLDVVQNRVGLQIAERVGLRYIDLIRELDGHPPESFLRSFIHGFTSESLGATSCQNRSITTATTPHGTMRIQAAQKGGSAYLPPDLAPTEVKSTLIPAEDETYWILDFDHYSLSEIDFQKDAIEQRMWELHAFIRKGFRAAVTEQGLNVWRKAADIE